MYYMKKKVSIVVPLYKSEKYLNALVDSILNQSYTNIELILVDDESPDKCGMICDQYAKKDTRVKVIHKKNGGCCDARNKGLELVTGDYLMFADGDDWMELDCVEYLVDLMETNNCQMSMTDSVYTTFDTQPNKTDNIRVWTPEQATCGILYLDIPVGPWNKLYTTSIVRNHKLCFDIPWFGEGLYFSVMNAQYSRKIAVGHKRVYNYRLDNPNSGTTLKEVKHALNARHNIRLIADNLVVRTPKTVKAANWHKLINCKMIIFYVLCSKNSNEYSNLVKETIKDYRHLCKSVIFDSHIGFLERVKYFCYAFAPVYITKRGLLRMNK